MIKKLIHWLVALFATIHRGERGSFTLVGWQESIDQDGVLTNIAAILDQHVSVSGDRIYVPPLNKLVAEYACQGDNLYHIQLQSPSLRRVALLDLPVCLEALNPANHNGFVPHFDSPLELAVNEGVEALANRTADGAVVGTVLAWLADGELTPVKGEIFTVRVTASIISILGSWVNGALTFSQTLPVGRYAIVGANFLEDGGDLIAFRFVVPGYEWRPGGLAVSAFGANPIREQLYGGMGVWCEFDSVNPPTLDVIAGAAAAQTIVGYVQLMKVG